MEKASFQLPSQCGARHFTSIRKTSGLFYIRRREKRNHKHVCYVHIFSCCCCCFFSISLSFTKHYEHNQTFRNGIHDRFRHEAISKRAQKKLLPSVYIKHSLFFLLVHCARRFLILSQFGCCRCCSSYCCCCVLLTKSRYRRISGKSNVMRMHEQRI